MTPASLGLSIAEGKSLLQKLLVTDQPDLPLRGRA
jgi:hypothetical protein